MPSSASDGDAGSSPAPLWRRLGCRELGRIDLRRGLLRGKRLLYGIRLLNDSGLLNGNRLRAFLGFGWRCRQFAGVVVRKLGCIDLRRGWL